MSPQNQAKVPTTPCDRALLHLVTYHCYHTCGYGGAQVFLTGKLR